LAFVPATDYGLLTTDKRKAAGGVLTAKQAPYRPGTAPALGLRAGVAALAIVTQTACFKEPLCFISFPRVEGKREGVRATS
jgi:hypothetical protein